MIARAAAALLLAIALWLIVSAEEPSAAWVPVTVRLTLDSAVALREPVEPVRAFVVGRRRDIFKLLQTPPILHRAVTDDTPDSVRIELHEQDLDLPIAVEAHVRDLRPRLLTVRLQLLTDSARALARLSPSPATR